MLRDFKKFAMRGNVVDLAVGFTVGAAFTTIVKSLVDDVLMPPVGLVLGRADFSDFFWLLRPGSEEAPPYATVADAQAAGAVTINYGEFFNNVLAFLVVAVAMFLLIRMVHRLDQQLEEATGAEPAGPDEPEDKKCPYCLSTIPRRAKRCRFCTSQLEEIGSSPPRPAGV